MPPAPASCAREPASLSCNRVAICRLVGGIADVMESLRCLFDSQRVECAHEKTWWTSCLRSDLGGKHRKSKISLCNNALRRKPDHACVLFVQHPCKNALGSSVRCGSFIACTWTFGNCDVATEGGIPWSSRFRWFA